MNVTGVLETMMYQTMRNQRTDNLKSTGTSFMDMVILEESLRSREIEHSNFMGATMAINHLNFQEFYI